MKCKIITRYQLNKLVELGIVKQDSERYYVSEVCSLFKGGMEKNLIGKTLEVECEGSTDNFPFKTSNYHIPYFILECNFNRLVEGVLSHNMNISVEGRFYIENNEINSSDFIEEFIKFCEGKNVTFLGAFAVHTDEVENDVERA